MSRALTRAALAAASFVCLVAACAFAQDGVSYGCSFCGHPTYAPYHYTTCPLYQDYSSGNSDGGGSSGGWSGPSWAEIAAQRAAERERLAELERQRQEELRRQRIARAAEFRLEVEQRNEEMRARLRGVFDLVSPSGEVDFDGREEPGAAGLPVENAPVDLQPTGSVRRDLEARLRTTGIDPALLAAQARRAADTSAFADRNYWSVPLEPPVATKGTDGEKSIKWRAWELTKWMTERAVSKTIEELVPEGEAVVRAKTIYDATTGLAKDMAKLVSPHTSWAIVYSPAEAERILGETEKAPVSFLRSVTDDKSLEHEQVRNILLGKE